MQRLVNENMREQGSPRPIRNETRRIPPAVQHLACARRAHRRCLGAVARAVERNNEFRRCSECGIWFELSPQTARSHKQFCSNACRTKAYRKRQAEAARLHGEGLALEDIARELESDPALYAAGSSASAARAARPSPRPNSGERATGWARTPGSAFTISIAVSPAPIPCRPI